jgi:hypothetical protein
LSRGSYTRLAFHAFFGDAAMRIAIPNLDGALTGVMSDCDS